MASMVQKTLEEKRLEAKIAKLRAKQDDLEEKARESKKRIQALKRKKKAVLTRQVRQAQARLNAHERRRRTRRLILMGTLLEHQVSQSEEALAGLLRDLDDFLKRDRDRDLFELPPLAEPGPDSSGPAPDLAPSSPELPPLRGWKPARLPDGDWGSRYQGDTRKLPDGLVGCSIEITTRGGDSWISTVVEVIQHEADYVLVRDSGKPSPA